MKHYIKTVATTVLVVTLLITLSACGNSTTSSASIVGKWTGTQNDGKAITLDILRGAPNVSAHLDVGEGATKVERDLAGTYVGTALDIHTTDTLGIINFNTIVSGNSMTGSYVTFQIGSTIGDGASFTLTKQ